MKVLFISTSVPPFPESQSIRNYFFIHALLNNGHEVVLVHPKFDKSDRTLEIIHDNLYRLVTDLPRLAKISKRLTETNKVLGRFFNLFINAFIPPDPLLGWEKLVINELIDYPVENAQVIVTSSGSYTAHIAGSILKKKYPNVKWIADYGDPWFLCPTWPGDSWIHKLFNKRCERKALSTADKIIWTTDETKDAYKGLYPEFKDKFLTIRCGYNRVQHSFTTTTETKRQFIFSYVGTAYKMTRNIQPIIETIVSMNNEAESEGCKEYIFKAVGPVSNKFMQNIPDDVKRYVTFTGHVDYLTSCFEISNKADILVFIGNRGGLQIPAKIYQYLSTDVPIIFVSQSEDDPSAKLASVFKGLIYVNQDNIREMKVKCSELIRNYEKHKNESVQRSIEIESYGLSWNELSTNFSTLVSEL